MSATTTVDAVRAFWSDPDAGVGAVDAWMRDGSDRALRCGWAACLIDRPEGERPATAPGTVGRWLEPDELLDWRLDERGAFEWARLCSRTEASDPITGAESEREVITVWTRAHWRRFDLAKASDRWAIEGDSGEVPHDLGRVPLAVLRWIPTADRDDLYAPSVLSGSVSAAVELFNVRSEQRSIERDCVFPVLCVQTSDGDRFQASKVGTHSGLTVEPGMAFPAFISPDAAVTVHYAGRVDELTTRIYEAAYLDRPSAATVAPESGVARAYRFRQMSGLLVTAAGEHEAFEREVVAILAAWDGADAAASKPIAAMTPLEIEDAVAEDARAAQRVGKAIGRGAEILADDEAVGAVALDPQRRQHRFGNRVADRVIVDVGVQPVHHVEMRVGEQGLHRLAAHFLADFLAQELAEIAVRPELGEQGLGIRDVCGRRLVGGLFQARPAVEKTTAAHGCRCPANGSLRLIFLRTAGL